MEKQTCFWQLTEIEVEVERVYLKNIYIKAK